MQLLTLKNCGGSQSRQILLTNRKPARAFSASAMRMRGILVRGFFLAAAKKAVNPVFISSNRMKGH